MSEQTAPAPDEVKPTYRIATLAETWEQQLCQDGMSAPDMYCTLSSRIAKNCFNTLAALGTAGFTAYTVAEQYSQGHWGLTTFAAVASLVSLGLAYDHSRVLRADNHLKNINRAYGAEVTREIIRRTAEFHDRARPQEPT